MPTIALTNGKRARVDWCDYREFSRSRWWFTRQGYATRRCRPGGRLELMHRIVMGLQHGDGQMIDHKNRDKLDNRRSNLRLTTHRANAENRKHSARFGVGVREQNGRFHCVLQHEGKTKHLGVFDSPEEAMRAREKFLRRPEAYPLSRRRSPHGPGIDKRESGRFRARINKDRRVTYLGTFDTAEQAKEAQRRFLENQS